MNSAARLVIHYIGVAVLLILAGVLILTGLGKAIPEWLKDPVLVGLGALAGLLAKTGADANSNVGKAETVNVNPPQEPSL